MPDVIANLRNLAHARRARGDPTLVLQPATEPQEFFDDSAWDDSAIPEEQGLVLEGDAFEERDLTPRQAQVTFDLFCDGTRRTYFLGHDDALPLYYGRNIAVLRTRHPNLGYHLRFREVERQQETILAPFGLMALDRPTIVGAYQRLGLLATPYADLCWHPPRSDEPGDPVNTWRQFSNQAWQVRARRRARRLMERSEQFVTLAGSILLTADDSDSKRWLFKDGSLFQMDKRYLKQPTSLRNVVACVKTHPVAFFGRSGERLISQLKIGQRTVAFLPRPQSEAQAKKTLHDTDRPIISWYLRVHEPKPDSPNLLSGVVRLDIVELPNWPLLIDDVSWAVLDEFYGISARPDPRYDVMPYGIHDVECYLQSRNIPAELLLAPLT